MQQSLSLVLAALLLILPSIASAECVQIYRSSWITELCFGRATVTATMSGKQYAFCGISRGLFDAWVSADSVGKFYNQTIRGNYSCR